jgi:hypothetical protein
MELLISKDVINILNELARICHDQLFSLTFYSKLKTDLKAFHVANFIGLLCLSIVDMFLETPVFNQHIKYLCANEEETKWIMEVDFKFKDTSADEQNLTPEKILTEFYYDYYLLPSQFNPKNTLYFYILNEANLLNDATTD